MIGPQPRDLPGEAGPIGKGGVRGSAGEKGEGGEETKVERKKERGGWEHSLWIGGVLQVIGQQECAILHTTPRGTVVCEFNWSSQWAVQNSI